MLSFQFAININHSFSKTNSSIDTWTTHVSSAGGCSILQHRPETSWKLRERAGNPQETQGPEERVNDTMRKHQWSRGHGNLCQTEARSQNQSKDPSETNSANAVCTLYRDSCLNKSMAKIMMRQLEKREYWLHVRDQGTGF